MQEIKQTFKRSCHCHKSMSNHFIKHPLFLSKNAALSEFDVDVFL